jgi:hypothetical protein
MWRIEETPQQAREILESKPLILLSRNNPQIYWDARYGPETKKTFVMSSLIFIPQSEISTNEYFDLIKQDKESCLEQLANHIQSIFHADPL